MEIYFSAKGITMRLRCPFAERVFELDVEKGMLDFKGHFYAQDDELPFLADMSVRHGAQYSIEIYRREILENTSEYSDEVDGMRVCFFPSNRMRIWFNILPKGK